jgi:hypothetical protein
MGKDSSVGRKLLAALAKIDRPGTFCTSGTAPAVLPGLEIDGVGTIGVPLPAAQAKELKQHFEQAPYGKGTKTLVDTDVRRVWRLTPDRFSLTNPAWVGALHKIVSDVQRDLGLEKQKLKPHLYDLLLYEKGSFFLPHKDGEKLDRMVATLVIMLPSTYAGGELVVRHEGQEAVVDFSGEQGKFQTHYAAFYADCEHEVKPLQAGFRLCLVYNLTLAKSKEPIRAPRSREHVPEIARALREWPGDADGPQKLALTLEHEYTEKGLAWDALKGVDRARANALAEAAREAGCQAWLALLTYWQVGDAEGDYGGYGRWGRYGDYDEDDDGEDDDGGDHTMGEIIDTSLHAEHWQSPTGERPPFGKLSIDEDEVVPIHSLTSGEPEEDYEGFTGNAGATLERWYRHGVIVLWPDSHEFDVLCSDGADKAVPALKRMMSAWRKAKAPEAAMLKERCRLFAGRLIAEWPERSHGYPRSADSAKAADPRDLMPYLLRLEDPKLISAYLREVLVKDASLEPGKAVRRAIAKYGWATFEKDLVALFAATNGKTVERNVKLLAGLCASASRLRGAEQSAEAERVCRAMARASVSALVQIDAAADSDYDARRINRAKLLARLARALLSAGLEDLLSEVMAHVASRPKQYPLREVRLAALLELGKWLKKRGLKHPSPALSQWIAGCRSELEALTAAAPLPPADFRRDATVECKCRDCAELNRFLKDPREEQHAFQMAQGRRGHLEQQITSNKCDLVFTTDRRPRPQVLVCTKTTKSHERRVKQYQEDVQQLAVVRALEARVQAESPDSSLRKWKPEAAVNARPRRGKPAR